MPRRDLIRNVIIVGVLVLALILLRIFVFHPFSINDKMANASVKTGDLVVATRNAQVDRSDLVLYKVGGKEYLGRVIDVYKRQDFFYVLHHPLYQQVQVESSIIT